MARKDTILSTYVYNLFSMCADLSIMQDILEK